MTSFRFSNSTIHVDTRRIAPVALTLGFFALSACTPSVDGVRTASVQAVPPRVEVPPSAPAASAPPSAGEVVPSATSGRNGLEVPDAPPPGPFLCGEGAPSLDALCTCLLNVPDEPLNTSGEKATCDRVSGVDLGSPRLMLVGFGAEADAPGERLYVFVAHDGPAYRIVAQLGHDFEPGAFGVHNQWRFRGAGKKLAGGRDFLVLRSTVENRDFNMAGLELCSHDVEQETVCALGDATRPTRCVVVPTSTSSGCGPGAEVDPNDVELKAEMAERAQSWSTSSAAVTWSLTDDGAVVVEHVKGDKALVPSGTLGRHRLLGSPRSVAPSK